MKGYKIRWTEANSKGAILTKEKGFSSEKKRLNFINKLAEKASFLEIVAYSDPQN